MVVRPVSVFGAKACDTFERVLPFQAEKLRADGFEGMFCYAEYVTSGDLDALLGAGMWVGFVLIGLAASTAPTAALGSSMATSACARLRSLGVPPGVTLFGDLEGEGHSPEQWIAFANAQADATRAAGDVPGHYVGAGLGLTSAELYSLNGQRYWKGGSRIVDRHGQLAEPACGWCIVQGTPLDIDHGASGLRIDLDAVWQDYRGRAVTVLAPS